MNIIYTILYWFHVIHTIAIYIYPWIRSLQKYDKLFLCYLTLIAIHWVIFGECILLKLKKHLVNTESNPLCLLILTITFYITFCIVWNRQVGKSSGMILFMFMIVTIICGYYIARDLKRIAINSKV